MSFRYVTMPVILQVVVGMMKLPTLTTKLFVVVPPPLTVTLTIMVFAPIVQLKIPTPLVCYNGKERGFLQNCK